MLNSRPGKNGEVIIRERRQDETQMAMGRLGPDSFFCLGTLAWGGLR